MSEGVLRPAGGCFGRKVAAVRRWLVIALALTALAACEHGNLSYSRSTGSFSLPFGSGSQRNS